jgi:hypothetical protein
MTEKIKELKPKYCSTIPIELEQGVLYISKEHGTAIHLCPCGCGNQAVISLYPVFKDGWRLTDDGNKVSVTPSILNKACGSHYFIEDNKILWESR